jgi:hypothetical protein
MPPGATIDVHVYNMSSTIETYPGDDEDWITRLLPQKLNRTSAAVSKALAVHFSFFMQRAGLENNTDLLDRCGQRQQCRGQADRGRGRGSRSGLGFGEEHGATGILDDGLFL